MRYFSNLLVASTTLGGALAQAPKPDSEGRYTLVADGIKAQFIEYGATLTNLWVKDKNGVERDIVLGYDNTSYYPVDPGHPTLNTVPGRYVNRIGKAQFTIDGVTYNTEKNDGQNTLHSGTNNWSFRVWNVTGGTNNSITFSIYDPALSTKMPGRVEANVTYSLEKNKWKIVMDAISPEAKTPIMLTQHTYFQLDAFANPDTRTVWNHTLYAPEMKRILPADSGALPTGTIFDIPAGNIDDFWSTPRQLGFTSGSSAFETHCGTGCHGYNHNWLFNDDRDKSKTVLTLSSGFSGIKAEMTTDQDAVVLYTCNWNDGKSEFKDGQGIAGKDKFIPRDGCIAIEAQDYVNGINHPEWGRTKKQIYGPGDEYHWEQEWTFGTI